MSRDEAQAIINDVDLNADGKLDYIEVSEPTCLLFVGIVSIFNVLIRPCTIYSLGAYLMQKY